MADLPTFDVPFKTETVEHYHVKARSRAEAAAMAAISRERGTAPQHVVVTKFSVGTVAPLISDPTLPNDDGDDTDGAD